MTLHTKYAPSTFAEYGHHSDQREKVLAWFKKPYRILVLHGPANSGKSTFLKLAIQSAKYVACIQSASELFADHMKEFKCTIERFSQKRSLDQYFIHKQKNCIVIEDYDPTKPGSQNILKHIQKMTADSHKKKKGLIPIILCTSAIPRKVSFEPRPCFVSLPLPSASDLQSFIQRVLKGEPLALNDALIHLISSSNRVKSCFDVLHVIQGLQSRECVVYDAHIVRNEIDNFNTSSLTMTGTKETVLRRAIEQCTSESTNMEHVAELQACDSNYASQVLFENAPCPDFSDPAVKLRFECIIAAKQCESMVYSLQQWELYEYIQYFDAQFLPLYKGKVPPVYDQIPKINSKSCQHFYQLKSQQIIHQKFAKSDTRTYMLCDSLLCQLTKNKKERNAFMEKNKIDRSDVNAIKRLSLSKYKKIKF